jgi:amino acid transporter
MERFLSWRYWFNLRPEPLTDFTFKIFIVFLIVLIILSIYSYYSKSRSGLKNGLWLKIFNFSFTNSLLGVMLLFFNYEIIPFFTARFFLALWAIGLLIWIFLIIKEFKKVPNNLEKNKRQKEFEKYLP